MSFSAQWWGWYPPYTPLALGSWGWLEGTTVSEKTYCERAFERLIEQFRSKDDFKSLICSYVSELQELDTVFKDLRSNRSLDNATGVQLEGLGEILDVNRYGLSDPEYRAQLKLKASLLNGNGEAETIISLVKNLTESEKVIFLEEFPAKINIWFDGLEIPENLFASVKSSTCGGVGLSLSHGQLGETSFAFAEEGGIPDPDGEGFGENNFPLLGGIISEIIT